jgi:hypothetical protein
MIEILLKIIFCHLFGDYVLQSDFIARTKGENWYHLLVHCVLYCLPFYVVFGFSWKIAFIFVFHVMIDAGKARYKFVNYFTDQVMHYTCALIFLS